jgi:hypothetical protein
MKKWMLILSSILCVAVYSFSMTTSKNTTAKIRPLSQQVVAPIKVAETQMTSAPSQIDKMTFTEDLKDTLIQFPTSYDLQNLSEEEKHGTPESVKDGAVRLATVVEAADQEPWKREETMSFLQTCAQDDHLATTIRALCYSDVLKKITDWDVFVEVSEMKVPTGIQNLAMSILE